MCAKELTVLMVEPGKHPKVTKIKRYTELFWEPKTFNRSDIEATMTCHFF